MSLKTLINSIGHFFGTLFKNTVNDYHNLPQEQQSDIIDGINVSQVIKLLYKEGETAVVKEVASRLNVSDNVAMGVVDYALKSWGINETTIQAGLDQLAAVIDKGITDDGWNALFKALADCAAMWLGKNSGSGLNWITLGLGVLEAAYQLIFKKVK